MTVDEALQFADHATKGATFYEGMRGPLMTMAVLAAEVRRLRGEQSRSIYGRQNAVTLDADAIEFILMNAGIEVEFDKEECCGVGLWVGETTDQDGDVITKTYGLQSYCDECPEEGSVCLVEFDKKVKPEPSVSPEIIARVEALDMYRQYVLRDDVLKILRGAE